MNRKNERKIDRNKVLYKRHKKHMTLQKITNIHAFGDDIKNGAIKINKIS